LNAFPGEVMRIPSPNGTPFYQGSVPSSSTTAILIFPQFELSPYGKMMRSKISSESTGVVHEMSITTPLKTMPCESIGAIPADLQTR